MKYRKKPVVVEAVRWSGRNVNEIAEFMGATTFSITHHIGELPVLEIPTLEGTMRANCGDYIVKEPFPTDWRKFYPCKPDIFEKTYEPVGDL